MRSTFPRTTVAVRWTCPRLAVRTIVLCIIFRMFSSLVARGETPTPKRRWGVVASGEAKAKRGYVSVQRVENGPGAAEPPVLTEEQRGAVAVARAQERPLLEVPELPDLQPEDYDQPGPATELLYPSTAADPQTGRVAGGDIAIWRNSSAAGVQQNNECGNPTGPTCQAGPEEPTVGVNRDVLWLSGNKYAAISVDGGITWAYRNPFDFFPADGINDQPAGIFNGDQVVYYSPMHDLMFWYLQYDTVRDGANNPIAANIQRLAWARSREDMLNGIWNFADFSPASFGYANNTFWLDFPDLAVTDNFLYITTNIFRLDGAPGGGREHLPHLAESTAGRGRIHLSALPATSVAVLSRGHGRDVLGRAYFHDADSGLSVGRRVRHHRPRRRGPSGLHRRAVRGDGAGRTKRRRPGRQSHPRRLPQRRRTGLHVHVRTARRLSLPLH